MIQFNLKTINSYLWSNILYLRRKKNEDLDSLLKNYEKEVTNLKQHNKMLQKKIDSNTKPNA
jgi:ribosomal protein L29